MSPSYNDLSTLKNKAFSLYTDKKFLKEKTIKFSKKIGL